MYMKYVSTRSYALYAYPLFTFHIKLRWILSSLLIWVQRDRVLCPLPLSSAWTRKTKYSCIMTPATIVISSVMKLSDRERGKAPWRRLVNLGLNSLWGMAAHYHLKSTLHRKGHLIRQECPAGRPATITHFFYLAIDCSAKTAVFAWFPTLTGQIDIVQPANGGMIFIMRLEREGTSPGTNAKQ